MRRKWCHCGYRLRPVDTSGQATAQISQCTRTDCGRYYAELRGVICPCGARLRLAKEYAGVFMCDSGACYRNYSMSQILGMIQQHKLALHRVQEAKGESMPHPDDYDWPERNLPTVKEEQVYINGWGQKTRIDKMGTQHIINCIGLCQKKRERLMAVQADFEETKCLEPAIKELEDTICALCDELNNRRLN